MKTHSFKTRTLGTAIAAALAAATALTVPSVASAQTLAPKPSTDIVVAVGTGRMVRLNATMSDLFVANDGIADVQVRSANQIYIFGKAPGETTVYATNKAGRVVYSANIHVGTNFDSIGDLLSTAMPDAQIRATPMNGVVLLTGTVRTPEDVEEAGRIVQAYVGDATKIISRLKTATPLQVMLKVTFAEVNRSLIKELGVNFTAFDPNISTGGFIIGQGSAGEFNLADGSFTAAPPVGTALTNIFGLFGSRIASHIDLHQDDSRVSILAEPTLTALSGETASFLAGGEFPIPVSQSLGSISVEYRQYGVGLAFTPTVLANGRISMRVRPEVSELTDEGSIRLNSFSVPALTTRRAETTVELGSGQSFIIGGLLRNTTNNSTNKAPWLGDLPILGALFRSNSFRRSETELVIVVTPYLVKPVSASQIALPTDGFRSAEDGQRVFMDRAHDSVSGTQRPGPVMAPRLEIAPGIAPAASNAAPTISGAPASRPAATVADSSATPGFTF